MSSFPFIRQPLSYVFSTRFFSSRQSDHLQESTQRQQPTELWDSRMMILILPPTERSRSGHKKIKAFLQGVPITSPVEHNFRIETKILLVCYNWQTFGGGRAKERGWGGGGGVRGAIPGHQRAPSIPLSMLTGSCTKNNTFENLHAVGVALPTKKK